MSETLYLKIQVDQAEAEKRTTKLTQSITKLTAEKKKYTKALKESNGADAKAAAALNKVNLKLAEQKKQLRLLNNSQKQNINSLGGLEARNARLANILKKVNLSTKTGQARFKALSTEMGKNQTRINQMNASIKRFQGNVGNYAGGIKSAFSQIGLVIGGVLIAFRTLDRLIGGSLRAFDQEAKALAKVEQAIKSTNKAAKLGLKELEITAVELQKNTLFGNETILNNATAQLLTFTNIVGENFLRTQAVALDVATVLDTTGDGTARLKDVSIQLGKALNDPVRNLSALSRAGIQFSDEQIKVIKGFANTNQLAKAQSLILGELEKQYGGQAKAAVVGIGSMQQLGNVIGDVKENIGGFLNKALTPIAKGLSNLLAPTELLSDALAEEQIELNLSIQSVTSLNEGNEVRKSILSDLINDYPEFLSDIDSETISNGELLKILKEINIEYQNKIKISVLEEEIAEKTKRGIEAFKEQRKEVKAINELYSTYVENQKEGLTLDEKINALQNEKLKLNADQVGVYTDIFDLEKQIRFSATTAQEHLNELDAEKIENQKEYNELLKEISLLKPEEENGKISKLQLEYEQVIEIKNLELDYTKEIDEEIALLDEEILNSKIEGFDLEKQLAEEKRDFLINIAKQESEAKIKYQDAVLNAAEVGAYTLGSLAKEGSVFEKVMFGVEKAIAIASVFVNLAREISALRTAAAIQKVTTAAIPGASLVIDAIMLKNIATAKIMAGVNVGVIAAQSIPTIKGWNKSKAAQGMLVGNSHAQGGIPIEAEGGEVIINKRSAAIFKDELSDINSYNGYGVKFAERGMYVPKQSNSISTNAIIERAIQTVSKIPVVVTERDITAKQRHVEVLENEGNL